MAKVGKGGLGAKSKQILSGVILSLGLSLSCIWAVSHHTDARDFTTNLLALGASTLIFAFLLTIGGWLVDALRLKILASAMGTFIPLASSLKITVIGSFMACVTPFDTGGEPLKVYFLHKKGLSIGAATAAVALGSFSHSTSRLALWLLVPAVMLVTGRHMVLPISMEVALIVGLAVYIFFTVFIISVIFHPKWVQSLIENLFKIRGVRKLISPSLAETMIEKIHSYAGDFRNGIKKVKSSGSHASIILVLSLVYWFFAVAVPALLLRRLAPRVQFFQVFSLAMTFYLIVAYAPTPGSSGAAEVSSAYFFAFLLPAKALGAFVFAWRFVTYYFTLLVGGLVAVSETVSWSMRKTPPKILG